MTSDAIGLDFGTTNSALAVLSDGAACLARFRPRDGGEAAPVFRSIVFFDPSGQEPGKPAPHYCGPDAIGRYLATDGEGRLMQSMKSHLASRSLDSTVVFGRRYRLEELIGGIVRALRLSAEADLGPLDGPVVAGRPIRFVGAKTASDDAFAEGRLRRALALGGFPDVTFEFEPVAAAHHYEARLQRDELVLIGDFGGGTSDFCLLKVGPGHRGQRGPERVIATAGIGLAGDAFDREILHRLVSPALGRGSLYRSLFDRELPIPSWVFKYLERWHRLPELAAPRNLRMLRGYARVALDPERIGALLHVIENNLGYALYRSVESTKVELSGHDSAQFEFRHGPVAVGSPLERSVFEGWIRHQLDRIEGCVSDLLQAAGTSAASVDRVFLTGGSAQVPAVRRLFDARFGADRVRSGDHLTSVASGLALAAAA